MRLKVELPVILVRYAPGCSLYCMRNSSHLPVALCTIHFHMKNVYDQRQSNI